jgi:hypothetical protein
MGCILGAEAPDAKKIALVFYSQRGSTAKLAAKLRRPLRSSRRHTGGDARDFDIEAARAPLPGRSAIALIGAKGRIKPFTPNRRGIAEAVR